MQSSSEAFAIPASSPITLAAAQAVERITGLHALSRIYEAIPRENGEPFSRTCAASSASGAMCPRTISRASPLRVLGVVKEILQRHGMTGLYTSKLFRYAPPFFKDLGLSAVEMGRSWIRAEYQKSYAPLLLLWKGIATFAAKNPELCVLFGPASISNEYSMRSRSLMARYLMTDALAEELAAHVRPRAPFRARPIEKHLGQPTDFDDLQEMLQEIENGRTVPVLLRQYLNVGGRVAALNVDSEFSDVLDALVVVDLRRTPEKALGRYMTPDAARAFLAHHAAKRGETK